ncbi:MAG: A/G-specific adenine glycosylase [Myxococcota bacterium]|nr:A/G-specific adenine glycosylase [Myxococcota bacterium]
MGTRTHRGAARTARRKCEAVTGAGESGRRQAPTTAAHRRRLVRIRASLLSWYQENRRDLPWRRSSDPYAIWISETMLQQTRVDTVIPYYERFLERFPDIEALATADEDDVFAEWAGLGYYSRARNLQKAARTLSDEYGGVFPQTAEELRALPGIGPYTAGALASIAFDAAEPIVDGNVIRVLTRVLGIREDTATRPVVDRLWSEAALLARGENPGDLNQAIMELGALVCAPRSPRCLICPLQKTCDARAVGDAEELPIKTRKTKQTKIEAVCAWLPRRGKLLVTKRPATGLMAGMWELAGDDLLPSEAPEEGLRRALRERVGLESKSAEYVGEIGHIFSHRKLRLHVFRCGTPRGRVALDGPQAHRWIDPDELDSLATGAATRKAVVLLRATDPAG